MNEADRLRAERDKALDEAQAYRDALQQIMIEYRKPQACVGRVERMAHIARKALVNGRG